MSVDLAARLTAALADGTVRPLGELACMAGAAPALARACLARLLAAGVVVRVASGARASYRLAGVPPRATQVPLRAPRSRLDAPTTYARTCYRHLAGAVGVAWLAACHHHGWLQGEPAGWQLTPAAVATLRTAGLVVPAGLAGHDCVDGTERRPHLGGPLGVALARAMGGAGWFVPVSPGRALRLTPHGVAMLRACGARIASPPDAPRRGD